MLHRQKNVDCALINVQLDNLFQFFLSNLPDSSLDLRDLPDEYFSVRCASHCLLSAWKENGLGVGLVLLLLGLFADRCSVVLERF